MRRRGGYGAMQGERDRIEVRRFVRPSLRGGLLLSVCLSVCLLYWQNFCLRTWTAILEYLPFPYARQYIYIIMADP